MIDIRGLSVTYQNTKDTCLAVDEFDLSLGTNDICAVIGPSGCGKSTVLYVLAGIIRRYSGQALIGGNPADPKAHRIGFVPQNYGLLEWADVYHNATLGLDIKKSDIHKHQADIDLILEKTGLANLRRQYPGSLSGGQRQRISIARSFILKPDILLMDEPFSALDAITREEMQDLFLRVWKSKPVSTIFVTHSIEEAIYLGTHIAVMSPSPGRIIRLLNNPLFGKDNLRMSNEYYCFTMELRQLVKEVWA